MNKRKRMVSIFAGVMAAVMLLTLVLGLLPSRANAASSSEIRRQINALKEEKKEIQEKIKEVQDQYEENENEIADIIARKIVIDQEVQLLHTQVENINSQITGYNTLIADKQDELDIAKAHYGNLNEDNKLRIRTMEEEGSLSYWEVLFRANSFSDLLDRLNMVEEISASDQRRLEELDEAADAVVIAQDALQMEKEDLEVVKQELDNTQAELDAKRQEADDLIQELLSKADDLEALQEEFEKMDEQFLKEIAQKEVEFDAAKKAEWAAYMATYVPPTTVGAGSPAGGGSSGGSSGGGTAGGGGGGGWVIPVSYTSITSPFGNRKSPTSGASSNHMGIDMDSTTGMPVVAAKAGVVAFAGWGNAAGNYVKIDHMDGYTSIYMHMNTITCSTGQTVSAGTQIGTVGATGVATGDHLHFGVTQNGVYVNPAGVLGI